MKSKEQIELAQELIMNLQDYVELAKTERKVKVTESKEVVKKQIDKLTNTVQTEVGNL